MSQWIDQTGQRDAIVAEAGTQPIALDTEFIRERTYYPRLALVQLRTGRGEEQLIDPLALPEPGALGALLQGGALKIMHSPGEDLQAFQHGWHLLVGPIFDTQLAAALTGHGAGKSYQSLVEELLGIHLEKGETRSDWLHRPLTESQRHYAAEDVRHLHALHQLLDARLVELGRRDWLAQDCARLVAAAGDDAPDPNPHLSSRAAQRMKPEQQARLRRLLLWRELVARRRDKPRSWILDNELVVQLALRPLPRDGFEALLDRHRRSPRHTREALWQEFSRPFEAAELDIPMAAEPDPAWREPLKAMRTMVARHAAELDIPDGLLCARRHLETLLATRAWPEPLAGWRAGILQRELMQLLP